VEDGRWKVESGGLSGRWSVERTVEWKVEHGRGKWNVDGRVRYCPPSMLHLPAVAMV
jgi:hypothetical protein